VLVGSSISACLSLEGRSRLHGTPNWLKPAANDRPPCASNWLKPVELSWSADLTGPLTAVAGDVAGLLWEPNETTDD
jgi:hypothetical protein